MLDCTIFETYAEANKELGLPSGRGECGDIMPIPALNADTHPEQYSCVVYVRKWTYEGNTEPPDFSFLGLECAEHLTDGYKTDLFILARLDGADSKT